MIHPRAEGSHALERLRQAAEHSQLHKGAPAALLLITGLLLTSCGGSDTSGDSDPEPETEDTATEEEAAEEEAGNSEEPAEEDDADDEPAEDDAEAEGAPEEEEEHDAELALCAPIPFANGATVSGESLSNCWTEFAILAGSVKSRVTSDDGPTGEAHIMYGNPIQVYSSFEEEGMELIINGDAYSYISNGHPVPPEFAEPFVELYRELAEPELAAPLLNDAEYEVEARFTYNHEGSRIPAFSFTAVEPFTAAGFTYESHVIWMKDTYEPISEEATLTGMGVTSTSLHEYWDWGVPIEIPEIE